MLDEKFAATMDHHELIACGAFKQVCQGFLGKYKAANYAASVDELIESYQQLGCNMSQAPLFSFSSFLFPREWRVSDEHGECFHQSIARMENRYKGKWSPAMLADFCWNLQRDESIVLHTNARLITIKSL